MIPAIEEWLERRRDYAGRSQWQRRGLVEPEFPLLTEAEMRAASIEDLGEYAAIARSFAPPSVYFDAKIIYEVRREIARTRKDDA